MKLTEFAVPDRTGRINGRGDELTSRECGVEIRLVEACDYPFGETPVIGTDTSLPGAFKTVPFAIDGFLRRGTFCAEPDDLAWFGRAFLDTLDYVRIYGWVAAAINVIPTRSGPRRSCPRRPSWGPRGTR